MADNIPTNPALWEKVQKLTKGEISSLSEGGKTVQGPRDGKGFTKFPSAYANGWASKVYKDLGGGWTKKKKARKFDRKHCESKTCDEMGFSEKASCRPYKNCYKSASGKHQLPPLPYAYDSLEPWISSDTLHFHHDKHHQAYVDGLNDTEKKLSYAKITGDLEALPLLNADLAFHWGGHYLHTVYWQCLGKGQQPSDSLKKQVEDAFGSWDTFKSMFLKSAESVQGSGWAVLVRSPLLGLQIAAVTNHEYRGLWDTVVLLPIDVWEHAYYLDHQNDRKAHLESIFDNCINWSYVEQRMNMSRVARGKAKKDVGHGGLDEWFSGHGGSKGKGEGATWGDWVSISPVTKKLPSGKKVQKGDIVGPCGISDDPDWKAETKGGKNPLKCMPRQKAYDMPKAERADKAKGKQKAEKSTPNSKKPTNTPTFDKKASSVERVFRSPKPFSGFRNTGQDSRANAKPKGLWYSCGSEWDDWCKWEMPHWITNSPHVHRIEVNLSRMLVIRTERDFDAFEAKYLVRRDLMDGIDWKSVAQDYDGIEICPYQGSRRMSSDWYYPWDVASGCIWGSGAIKSVEPIDNCKVAGSFSKKALRVYIKNAFAKLKSASIYKELRDADDQAKELLSKPTPNWLQRDYPYVSPPDDKHSLGELYYLSSLASQREKYRGFIQQADENFLLLFKHLCEQLGCLGEVDFDEISTITEEAAVLITKLKWKYNRARPYQIAEKYKVPFKALNSQTAHTPAYPSGHTIQAYLVASHISKIAPQHRKRLFQLADWISFSRLLGGYHWPSDVHFGKDVFRHIVNPEMPAAVKLGEEDV